MSVPNCSQDDDPDPIRKLPPALRAWAIDLERRMLEHLKRVEETKPSTVKT